MDLNQALQGFHFLRPLWLLALPPLCALAWWLARRRTRTGNWAQLIDAELLPALRLQADPGASGGTPWPWLALVWTLAAVALAGPSWVRDAAPAFKAPAAWMLVLDLSPSMTVADVAPDRSTRARYALEDVLAAARDARVGLIVFSDQPYTVTPLTNDVATVRALLAPLAPDIMPAPGDALAPALERAAELLTQTAARDPRIILLTDGFADPAAALAAARALREAGIILNVVGIGTASGAPQAQADGGFATDPSGQPQLARLDPALLQNLASAGRGRYVELPGLPALIGQLQGPSTAGGEADPAGGDEDIAVSRWRDGGVWLLPALVFLAAFLSRRGWL